MAASTVHTLLMRLGFDTSSLSAGANIAVSELSKLQASASRTAAAFVPTANALSNMVGAMEAVAGSVKGPQALNNMAASARMLTNELQGSASQINTALGTLAGTMKAVGQGTQSGQSIELVAQALTHVTAAANGAVGPVRNWLMSVRTAAQQVQAGTMPLARFNLMMQESARHAQLAANSSKVYGQILYNTAMAQIATQTLAAQSAQANSNAIIAFKMKQMVIENSLLAVQQKAAAQAAANANSIIVSQMKMMMVAQALERQHQQNIRAANALYAALNAGGIAASGAARGMDDATRSARQLTTEMSHAGNRAGFLQRTLSMAFAFSGGVAVTNVIAFAGNALLGFNSKLQQAQIAYENFLGSADKASAFIKKMEDFANVTPFDFENLNTSVQKLIAMGFAADEALPVLRALGDATAGLGGSQDKLDRIAIALGQIKTAGRVTSQDMRQLTEAGIPAWQMLADAIGKTQGETRKLAEAGLIPANKALAALVSGMNDRYGGMMEKQARTAAGAFATLRDTVIQAIAGAVKPAFDLLTVGLVTLADFMVNGGGKMIAPAIWAIGVAIGVALIPKIYGLAVAASAATVSIAGLAVPIAPLIALVTMLGIAWETNFLGIQDLVEPVVQALGAAFKWLGDNSKQLMPVIQALAVLIGVRLVASMAAATGALVLNSIAAAANAITVDGAALAQTRLAGAAGLAAGATGVLKGGLTGLVALLGGALAAAVGIFAAALVLLVLNFDRVMQGLRMMSFGFQAAKVAVLDFMASIPIAGELFKSFAENERKGLENLRGQIAAAEAEIAAKEAAAAGASGGTSAEEIYSELDKGLEKFLADIKASESEIGGATASLVQTFGYELEGVVSAAEMAGADAMYEMANAIRDRQDAPLAAFKELFTRLQSSVSQEAQIAEAYGMLTSTMLAQGLASGDPALRAWAEAMKKDLIARLDELTDGAYSAGQKAALTYLDAWEQIMRDAPQLSPDAMERNAQSKVGYYNDAWNKLKPSVNAVADAMAKVNKELEDMSANSEAVSDLNQAFSQIRQAANEFFREQHQNILDAIDDEMRHKNAILDKKAALNQAPVDAAQRALDARRSQIEEWRLREAIRTASSPEAYRDAVLALQDFLAQQHIDRMQSEVDSANDIIKEQQEANRRKAEEAKEAENRRYEMMQRDFERQLQLLQEYLAKHPGEWQNVEEKILTLLRGYGFSYDKAGKWLGDSFVAGLRDKIKAAATAAEAIGRAAVAGLYTGFGPAAGMIGALIGAGGAAGAGNTGGNTGGANNGGSRLPSGWIPMASGSWQILHDNLLAMLHKDEMVAPASVAPLLRDFGSRKIDGLPAAIPMPVASSGSNLNGRVIQFIVGDEKLGELTDKALYEQQAIYSDGGMAHVGRSSR